MFKKPTHSTFVAETYYYKCIELLHQIQYYYAGPVYLYMHLLTGGLTDTEQREFESVYHGSTNKVVSDISEAYDYTIVMISNFNRYCAHNGIVGIKDPDNFIRSMIDKNRREFFEQKLALNQIQKAIISLTSIEVQYRKSLNTTKARA